MPTGKKGEIHRVYINIWYNDNSKIVAEDRCRFRTDALASIAPYLTSARGNKSNTWTAAT